MLIGNIVSAWAASYIGLRNARSPLQIIAFPHDNIQTFSNDISLNWPW